jgi:hypothetical protein
VYVLRNQVDSEARDIYAVFPFAFTDKRCVVECSRAQQEDRGGNIREMSSIGVCRNPSIETIFAWILVGSLAVASVSLKESI